MIFEIFCEDFLRTLLWKGIAVAKIDWPGQQLQFLKVVFSLPAFQYVYQRYPGGSVSRCAL